MFVFFDGEADVEWVAGMDAVEIFSHVESYAIENFATSIVNELEFDVLHVFTNEFTCAKIFHATAAENGFLVPGAKWVEESEHRDELGGNF